MIKVIILIAIFAVLAAGKIFAQDSTSAVDSSKKSVSVKEMVCKKWSMKDCNVNGKTDDFDKTIVELLNDGSYNYTVKDDADKGKWEISGDTKIIFDKGTEDEEVWEITKIDNDNLIVKTKDEDDILIYTFIIAK